jgi:hypothetical protein
MPRLKGMPDKRINEDARRNGTLYKLRPSVCKLISMGCRIKNQSPVDFLEELVFAWADSDSDSDECDALKEAMEEAEQKRPDVECEWLTEEQKEMVADLLMSKPWYSEYAAIYELGIPNQDAGFTDFRLEKIGRNLDSFETEYFPHTLYTEQRKKMAVYMADHNVTMEQAYEKLGLGKAKNSATRAMPMRVRTANKKRHKVSR